MSFDSFIMVDWSARSVPSPVKPVKDAIFIGQDDQRPIYCRTRRAAMDHLHQVLDQTVAQGKRVLLGFDFAFGYPQGFAERLTGKPSALAVWDWLADHITDGPQNENNRFQIAAQVNAMYDGDGPLWGCPPSIQIDGLSPTKGILDVRLADKRLAEQHMPSAQPVWKLFTTGSVGSQTLLGLPHLQRLRRRYGNDLRVWPMESGWEKPDALITLVEIYPSMLRQDGPLGGQDFGWASKDEIYQIEDAVQVRGMARGFATLQDKGALDGLFQPASSERVAVEEGWIMGLMPKAKAESRAA
ncbi:hypothetical protein [Pseudaestuariivita rosea]|uniref:hypothetical protein n=1 Tax=Pseudaestuariivita rosea TaxID=2763263 RepID=UPI001ABB452D|nr:hypothetical protein [Pseudaestuariivita rosea]